MRQELVQGGDCEATVRVSVAASHGRRGSLWSPRFPRAKDVGWWVVLGTEEGELLALKRVRDTIFHFFLSFDF